MRLVSESDLSIPNLQRPSNILWSLKGLFTGHVRGKSLIWCKHPGLLAGLVAHDLRERSRDYGNGKQHGKWKS